MHLMLINVPLNWTRTISTSELVSNCSKTVNPPMVCRTKAVLHYRKMSIRKPISPRQSTDLQDLNGVLQLLLSLRKLRRLNWITIVSLQQSSRIRKGLSSCSHMISEKCLVLQVSLAHPALAALLARSYPGTIKKHRGGLLCVG
jgi:hypothetical protein